MNKWMIALLNTRILQNAFGRKRSNRGIIWATLLGLGASAAAYGLNRNRNKNMNNPLQNVMNTMQTPFKGQIPKAALAEFAKELAPDNLTNK
ncbi:hypothetical protein V7122_17110 [Bacillus sp. JJ1532]|uniref:hypothetical protein n=1 Tax=unclassified Bacillus (in: firmicutes) TaxID=185979 RepID=UPI002FFF3595